MDANFRVNEIFTDEDTYDVIAKCYDIIYDEEFEKFLGNPDEFSGKENASNLLKDSNYEISDEIRADIEDIFGVVEFDKENEYGAGYQFYDFGDDIDDFDDEFDAYYDGYTEEDDNPDSAYNRLKVNARESFNLRESLNQIDIDTYNKYDLLNLYESCNLSENEKRALANIVYDQDDPRVIYDTLNDRFVGGKEIEMPERVKDGVIHEDANKSLAVRLVDFIKDYDFYHYSDTLEVGDTEEDAIAEMDRELANPETAKSLLDSLIEMSKDEDLDDEQKNIVSSLISGVKSVVNKSTLKESTSQYDFKAINKELRRELPADEIDNYNMDLYVKVSPKSKEILKKYGIHNHPLLSTFIDQITHTRWYDLPFAYVPINDTEVTEGYELPDTGTVELYSDYEIAKDRARELDLTESSYGDIYNTGYSFCEWNESGDRQENPRVKCYYKFENGRPRPLTEVEREYILSEYGYDSFDNPALEDDMGTYFDDVQPELEEDWTHFTYKSGANPYIATNDKEANRIIRKYKDKCKKVKDGYYEIDDTSNETLSESKKPYSIHTVRQVKDFFRQGESLTNVISYLFTCDYEPEEVVDFLVTEIGCKEQLVKNNLVDGFGINVDNF